jgi:hypothetical protein
LSLLLLHIQYVQSFLIQADQKAYNLTLLSECGFRANFPPRRFGFNSYSLLTMMVMGFNAVANVISNVNKNDNNNNNNINSNDVGSVQGTSQVRNKIKCMLRFQQVVQISLCGQHQVRQKKSCAILLKKISLIFSDISSWTDYGYRLPIFWKPPLIFRYGNNLLIIFDIERDPLNINCNRYIQTKL